MMISDLPWIMAYCLGCTVLIEGGVAFLLGKRTLREQGIVFTVNIMTNPLLVSIGFCIMLFNGRAAYLAALAVMEILVVLGEGLAYKKTMKTEDRPYLLSLILNLSSFALGELINTIFF